MLILVFAISFLVTVQYSIGQYVPNDDSLGYLEQRNITVFGDVFQNTVFFTTTFPWIIDNIGGDLTVNYYLLGSGRYTVPQMCALKELKRNSFLQAQYLKCLAEAVADTQYKKCFCSTGIDYEAYKKCVHTNGHYASLANMKYTELGIDATPIIDIGSKNTIFHVSDTFFLKKICTVFGDDPPRGCINPFVCNATQETWFGNMGLGYPECNSDNIPRNPLPISLTTSTTHISPDPGFTHDPTTYDYEDKMISEIDNK